jgi:hypothetical protein
MGGGAFKLLKTGAIGTESAKQVEIRLANLRKILSIYPFQGRAEAGLACYPSADCRFSTDMANSLKSLAL